MSAQQGPLLNTAQHTLPRLGGSFGDRARKGEAGHSRDQDSSLKGAEAAEGSCHGPRDALPVSAQGPRAFLPLQIRCWFSRPRITVRILPSAGRVLLLHRQLLAGPQPGPDKGLPSRDRVSEPSQPLGVSADGLSAPGVTPWAANQVARGGGLGRTGYQKYQVRAAGIRKAECGFPVYTAAVIQTENGMETWDQRKVKDSENCVAGQRSSFLLAVGYLRSIHLNLGKRSFSLFC